MASARSPSPNPSRPSTPHRPRTPDNSGIRRSGGFISSDAPQKIPAFKPGRDAHPEQKENERNDPKTPRFMSPTISAASKAVALTPRKKVLSERNEVCAAVSDSVEEISIKSEVGYGARVVLGPAISSKQAASAAGAEEFSMELETKNRKYVASPSFTPSPVAAGPSEVGYGGRVVLGPAISSKQAASAAGAEEFSMDLEIKRKYVASPSFTPSPVVVAGPSEKPYDPKTNYLSPRQRFLCYKPNPRLEQYGDMEGGSVDVGEGRKLEDSLSSQSHEDISGSSEDEAQSSLEDVASLNKVIAEEVINEALPQKDCEDIVSPIVGVVEQVIYETHVPEPETQPKTPIGSNFKPKPRSKLFPLSQQNSEDVASPTMGVVEQVIHETYVPEPETPIGSNFKPKPRSKLFPLAQQNSEDVASPTMEVVEQVIHETYVPEPETQPKTPISSNFKPRSKLFPLPQQDCKDVASTIMAVVEQEINQTPVPVPEPETQPKTPIGKIYKPRSKFFPIVLVLVMACLFVPLSDSPLTSSSFDVLKTSSFGNQSSQTLHDFHLKGYVDLANARVNQIADRFWHRSVAYLSSMASHPKELGQIVPVNLTFSVVDQTVGFDFIYSATAPNQDHLGNRNERAVIANIVGEETGFGHDLKQEIAMEVSEYIKQDDSGYDDSQEMGLLEENILMEKQAELELEAENLVMQIPENVHLAEFGLGNSIQEDGMKGLVMQLPEIVHPTECGLDSRIEKDGMKGLDQEEENSTTHKLLETENNIRELPESTSLVPVTPNQAPSGDSLMEFVDGYRMADSIGSSQLSEIGPDDDLSIRSLAGISVAVTTILAVAVVILLMKPKPATADVYQGLSPKNPASISGSSENYSHDKWSPFDNVPVGMDFVGDAGPSEMSSSLPSSSSFSLMRGRRSRGEENLSSERKMRRESTVSSTSYGSFTTYERISAKKGCRDEDAVTPVRRSSRIRNQITSP